PGLGSAPRRQPRWVWVSLVAPSKGHGDQNQPATLVATELSFTILKISRWCWMIQTVAQLDPRVGSSDLEWTNLFEIEDGAGTPAPQWIPASPGGDRS